jgi:hypothetical protein
VEIRNGVKGAREQGVPDYRGLEFASVVLACDSCARLSQSSILKPFDSFFFVAW